MKAFVGIPSEGGCQAARGVVVALLVVSVQWCGRWGRVCKSVFVLFMTKIVNYVNWPRPKELVIVGMLLTLPLPLKIKKTIESGGKTGRPL